MTVPSIRAAQTRDIHHLVDIDLKSYAYPWSVDEWRKLADDPTCIILIAAFKIAPVAVCVWKKKPAVKEGEILRLATKKKHRNLGAGSFLLKATEKGAKDYELDKVTIVVPEINCFPGHADDVSRWLLKREFRAMPPILKNRFYMYGQRCDGFKFEKIIGGNHA